MIKETINKHYDEAKALRQAIHQEPEIAFEEVKTNQKIRAFLDKHQIPYVSGIAKTGILATIEGSLPGKTILLRADMDALPMDENPNNPYASQIPGRMHACGHDGHTAGLCLAGATLNQMKHELKGTVKLLFQPAEEAIGGAEPMIKAGVLEGVDMAFGAHLWGSSPSGKVYLKKGPMMASPDNFIIKVKGVGGHGSKPQVATDPILMASQIVIALQTIVSRQISPLEAVVISVGKMHGGTAPNIIPEEVVLEGTIRTLNNEIRAEVPKKMETLAKGIAESYGGHVEFTYLPAYPVLVNNPEVTNIAYRAASEFLNEDQITFLEQPDMGGEDFAYIAQAVPSTFMYVGIMEDKPISHHHPDFHFDDKHLKVLSELLVQCVLEANQ